MKVYHPQIEVTLIKTIERSGMSFDGDNQPIGKVDDRYKTMRIDLTQFLGEGGGVRTSKSVREPAGGFSITLLDKMHPALMDSVYALIEPMDMVEIRFCHDASKLIEKRPPVVMRGFVSEIRRDESMGSDGKPSRKVILTGQDMGKLWQIFLIYYLQVAAIGSVYLTEFRYFEKYGKKDGIEIKSARDFVEEVVGNVLNPFLKKFSGVADSSQALKNGFTHYVTTEGTISPFRLSAFNEGSLHAMLAMVLDVGVFNELYIEDRQDEVAIILRPLPLFDANDTVITREGDGKNIAISAEDIQSITSSRSDSGVGNWYWAVNKTWVMINDTQLRLAAQEGDGAGILSRLSYPNSDERRYGFRKMQVQYQLGDPATLRPVTGSSATIPVSPVAWVESRRNLLGDLNKDNVVFERGTLRVRGNEEIKAGIFVTCQRGGAVPDKFYVVSVDHDYVPYQGFFTTINYERGTGFINRAKYAKPYWKELDVGGIR